jgi:pyrimidine-specific ribonucleoside hydrolase
MRSRVITVTDLYHPPEDPGDNFDLLMPYGLDRIDLRAVILDVSIEKRESVRAGVDGYPGPREPGVIPVTQLNAVFGRQVPFGISPFARMRDLDDRMTDVPAFQQTGVELLLETLRASEEPVHVMSFGSARPIAVAFNREPELMREKVARIHLSAGSTSLDYLEWNVYLDPLAMIRVVDSGLPLSLYPCATEVDCYSYGEHNTLWWFEDLAWIERMHPALRRYLTYALGVSTRVDFLRALDEEAPDDIKRLVYSRRHAVWETAAWMEVSGSALVRHADGSHEIVARDAVAAGDEVIPNEQVPCRVRTHESGLYTFELMEEPGHITVFRRGDPRVYEDALRTALPRLYCSFVPGGWQGSTVGSVRDARPARYAGPVAA